MKNKKIIALIFFIFSCLLHKIGIIISCISFASYLLVDYYNNRENYKSFTYRGHIASKEKKFKAAEMLYRMATFIGKEKRDEEFYGLGTVNYELKKTKQAIFYFDKSFKENRKNYKALYQLAKLSDDYYKDKKIAYNHYIKYLDRFEDKDITIKDFVKERIKEIKKVYFLRGESLE